MVAGGRVGILALSHEIGADDRLVGFLQYLRVLIVVLLMLMTPIPLLDACLATTPVGEAGTAPPVGPRSVV